MGAIRLGPACNALLREGTAPSQLCDDDRLSPAPMWLCVPYCSPDDHGGKEFVLSLAFFLGVNSSSERLCPLRLPVVGCRFILVVLG